MAYRIDRSEDANRDLERIFRFLLDAALDNGLSLGEASSQAGRRMDLIDHVIDALGRVPHQGTLHSELGPGLRNATKDRAILYFAVDDAKTTVRIIAVFFGSQDHTNAMLRRIRASRDEP